MRNLTFSALPQREWYGAELEGPYPVLGEVDPGEVGEAAEAVGRQGGDQVRAQEELEERRDIF